MSKLWIERIEANQTEKQKKIADFLLKFDLLMDQVDWSLVVWNEQKIVATCSKYQNLIKCLAVDLDYQNLNLTNTLVTQIMNQGFEQNITEWFVLTKFSNQEIFQNLNFRPLYWDEEIVFLTNQFSAFQAYENYLKQNFHSGNNGAVVINANPLTNGHLFLIEQAAQNCDFLYLIPVKEDVSFFTYQERKMMLAAISKRFKNVILLEGSQYLISLATFPSYFFKSSEQVIKSQALLDAKLFVKLFKENLEIKTRFVGTEPLSQTTNLYNQTLTQVLKENGLKLVVIERKTFGNMPISASKVREEIAFNPGNWEKIKDLVPWETLEILKEIDFQTRLKTKNNLVKKDY